MTDRISWEITDFCHVRDIFTIFSVFYLKLIIDWKLFIEELIFMNLTKEQKLHSDKNLKNKYEILRKLGEGCFGSIYGAINLANKKEVALKI